MCMCTPSLKLTSHGNVAFSFANLTFHGHVTVPKTNIAPENRPAPKRKQSSNHHFFKCKRLVSGGYVLGLHLGGMMITYFASSILALTCGCSTYHAK